MLQALVVSTEPRTVHFWRQTLREYGIEAHVCCDFLESLSLISRLKFDALVIDDADESWGIMLLERVRAETMNRKAVILGIVGDKSKLQTTFDLGAHFVLLKRTPAREASKTVRAAMGLMVAERRRYFRYSLDLPVNVGSPDGELEGKMIDISSAGAAVRVSRRLEPHTNVELLFSLPRTSLAFDIKAETVWSDATGRAGLHLVNVPPSSQAQLDAWLNERFSC